MSIKKLLNPDMKYPEQGLVFHKGAVGCCDDTALATCSFTVTAASITAVTSMTIVEDGVSIVLPITTASNSVRDIRKGIADALKTAGYDPYYKLDPFIGIDIRANSIILIGSIQVTSITVNSVVVAAVKKCNIGKVCQYILYFPYETAGGTLGATTLGASSVYAEGNLVTVAAAINGAITTEGLTLSQPAQITEEADDERYRAVLYIAGNVTVTRSDEPLAPVHCFSAFTS
jgi:hypothetical protein